MQQAASSRLYLPPTMRLTTCCGQDAPRDVPAFQLAQLTSTSKVLCALQKAYTAKQRILANLPPVRVDAVQLPDLTAEPPQRGHIWTNLHCIQTALSTCGGWLAVVLQGRQQGPNECRQQYPQQTVVEGPAHPYSHCQYARWAMHEVILYSMLAGFQQQARIFTGTAEPVLQWAPRAPHLSLAQLPKLNPLQIQSGLVGAVILDADSSSVLQRVGQTENEVMPRLTDPSVRSITWSPTCELVLIHGGTRSHPASAGWLAVISMHEDRVLAQAQLIFGTGKGTSFGHTAVWHPSSKGILLCGAVELEDAAPFHQAGFVVGSLSRGYYLEGPNFLANAEHLVVGVMCEDEFGLRLNHALLRCCIEGQQMSFTVEDHADLCPDPFDRRSALSQIRMLAHLNAQHPAPMVAASRAAADSQRAFAQAQLMHSYQHLSPSGRFLLDHSPDGLYIMDRQTNAKPWKMATAEPLLMETQQALGLLGGSLGLQNVAHPLDQACDEYAWAMEWAGWLPSGLGVLCRAYGVGQGLAPHLVCLRYA